MSYYGNSNLLADGCQNALFIWNGYIADGHNRYTICRKHNIPFEVVELAYDNKTDVMRWMIDGQLGRRNLNTMQRVAITEKYRPALEAKAKENLKEFRGNQYTGAISANLPKVQEPINTRAELAKLANTKERTYSKAVAILNSENEEVKQKVLDGKQTIDSGYNEIRPKLEKPLPPPPVTPEVKQEEPTKPTTKKCLKCKQVKPITEFKDGYDFQLLPN
jgi:hypothetical protein